MSNATTATDSTESDQSADSTDSQANSRSVAKRVFASELTVSPVTIQFSQEDDAPQYQLLRSGEPAHRVAIAGVLTEVSEVSSSMLNARICDPTGPVECYAGQYQPDAQADIQALEAPENVMVVGKTSTYEPENWGPLVSITVESMTPISQNERERWTAETIERTADRIDALEAGQAEYADLTREQYPSLDENRLRGYLLEAADGLSVPPQ